MLEPSRQLGPKSPSQDPAAAPGQWPVCSGPQGSTSGEGPSFGGPAGLPTALVWPDPSATPRVTVWPQPPDLLGPREAPAGPGNPIPLGALRGGCLGPQGQVRGQPSRSPGSPAAPPTSAPSLRCGWVPARSPSLSRSLLSTYWVPRLQPTAAQAGLWGPHGTQEGRPGGGDVGRAAPAEVAGVVLPATMGPWVPLGDTQRSGGVEHLRGTWGRHGEGDARGMDTQQRPRASGQEAGVVLTHAGAWGRVLGQLGQPRGGRGGGSPGHLAGGPLRSILARARPGCCAGKTVLKRALAEGCPPGTPEHPCAPEKVQQPPRRPGKVGVRSGGAPLPPRRKGQASAEEGMADGQSAKEVAGAGRHLEQAHGAGVRAGETGAAVPGGPDALATGSGPLRSRAASPVVPGPGLPPHLALAGETRQGCGWGAGGQGQRGSWDLGPPRGHAVWPPALPSGGRGP